MNIAGLIITGNRTDSVDFGAIDRIGNLSVIARIILTLRQAGVKEIVLVCEEDKELEKEVAFLGVTLLKLASQDETTELAQIKKGLEYLQPNNSQVVLSSDTVPLFHSETVKKLLTKKGAIILPLLGKEQGFPVVLDQRGAEQLLSSTCHGLLSEAFPLLDGVESLPVDDVGVVVRNSGDFRGLEALEQHSLQALRPEIKVRLAREKPFLGPGTRQLLELIEPTGSVREACGKMGLSYSKGWSMLRLMEEQLGEPLVQRQQGGRRGGSAALTPLGKTLLQQFSAYEAACQQAAEELFGEYFGEFQ